MLDLKRGIFVSLNDVHAIADIGYGFPVGTKLLEFFFEFIIFLKLAEG